jgi:hypothetical protein
MDEQARRSEFMSALMTGVYAPSGRADVTVGGSSPVVRSKST